MWWSTVGMLVTLTLGMLAAPLTADAQHARKIPHVGVLFSASSFDPSSVGREVLRQALHDLGYIEGQTIALEWRSAEQRVERLLDLASELAHRHVDVIVAGSHPAIEAARRATTTIPIVMIAVGDPVQAGFVESIARPGGNITGVNAIAVELVEKQLELLKETVPRVTRVAVIGSPRNLAHHRRELQRAAQGLGVHIQSLAVSPFAVDTLSDEIIRALEAATREGAGALLVLPNFLFVANERRIAELAAQNGLPAIFWHRGFAEAGGLISYGASLHGLYQRVAYYVDRILKGAKPADLPVEHPTKFELALNLKTAKALGMTMPPSLLLLADEVIQ